MARAEATRPRITVRDGVIALSGRITGQITGELMDAYVRMGAGGKVCLDFAAVDRLDVSGLNALITLYEQAGPEKRRLAALNMDPGLRDVFRAARIDEAIVPEKATLGQGTAGPGTRKQEGADQAPATADRSPGPGPVDREPVPEPPGSGAGTGRKTPSRGWAAPVSALHVACVPEGAVSLNVEGLETAGPVQGFGRLWKKTYRMRLAGVHAGPREVIAALKEHFPRFQPSQNRFYPMQNGITPGEVVLINASTPAGPIYTGVWVLHADEDSFTFMTPQGHPEAGWVSFDAFDDNGVVTARVQGFARASDPLYELGFELVGSRLQEGIWKHVLLSLGRHFGIEGHVSTEKSCVGDNYQWGRAGNIRYNAQVRSMAFFLMGLTGLTARRRKDGVSC